MKYLQQYIQNTEDTQANFNLGREYESIGQTGAAISFYLRTAERAKTDLEQYEALLRMALCFEKQQTRDDTEKVLLQKAINLLVDRPEAYFLLSRLHERQKEWHDSYTVACMALKIVNFDHQPLLTDVQYPGKYGLLFEKGVSSWWVGLTEESREIMYDLKTNHDLDSMHTSAVDKNLDTCGLPKNTNATVTVEATAPATVTVKATAPALFSAINPSKMPGAWLVDNFYVDPNAVREFALAQEYQISPDGEYGYIGRRTFEQFLFPGLKEEFERIIGRKITRWGDHSMNGKFQYCIAGEPLVYHCDDQSLAGMLYLTPNAPYQSGTATYALKGTEIRHLSHPQIMQCFDPGSRNFDSTKFETVDMFGNVYNRLVIFNAGYLHSARDYFGWKPDNGRLWQMFFFD